MNFLVIGQGGREHALIKALKNSPTVKEIHALPGNPGIALEIICHAIDWRDFERVYQCCCTQNIDLVIIGPEDPLVAGLSDFLRDKGLLVVGPSQIAAQLEGSKVFAKEFMIEFNVATAKAKTVYSSKETLNAATQFSPPYVLKADGLAGGKGVVLCENLEELNTTAERFFEQKLFGKASEKALLEQYLPGYELSLLLLTNGQDYQCLPLAQDHKQLLEGDRGPNTGGMGTIAPLEVPLPLLERIQTDIIEPTLQGFESRKLPYWGVLFLGLMITPEGPKLLEYNCRMGDPETQVILPLLHGDWGHVFWELAQGKLPTLQWKKVCSACVVLAAPGYPDSPQKGLTISGDLNFQTHSSYFLHSGVDKDESGQWKTAGGRVLCAVGIGTSIEEARNNAYLQSKQVHWKGLQMRTDIGLRPPPSHFTS